MKKRLVIITTVPMTLNLILKEQPKFLSQYFDVKLITSNQPGFLDIAKREGVSVYAVNMNRGISPIRDAISLTKMFWLLRKLKPDVVHTYTPKAGLLGMMAAWLCSVPVRVHSFTGIVFTVHMGVKRFILKKIDKIICFCATKVVPEGLGVKAILLENSITKKSLNVIGYGNIAGVDTHFFSNSQTPVLAGYARLGELTSSKLTFVFVGRLHADKGMYELVAAFLKMPNDVSLILVGDIDAEGPLDQSLIRTISSHPRIHWVGFQNDIRCFLKISDLLILPSYREGFPNVLLQAGAMELPCIVTDISGCNEVIDGSNGWVVRPRDAEALLDAMQLAYQLDKSDLNMMGKVSRVKIKNRFERSEHWLRMRDFYFSEVGDEKNL